MGVLSVYSEVSAEAYNALKMASDNDQLTDKLKLFLRLNADSCLCYNLRCLLTLLRTVLPLLAHYKDSQAQKWRNNLDSHVRVCLFNAHYINHVRVQP